MNPEMRSTSQTTLGQESAEERLSPITPPLTTIEQPSGSADNFFFKNEQTGGFDGQSWDTEVEGYKATYGKIKAGTSHLHRIEGPEVVIVLNGSINIQTKNGRESGYGSVGYSTGMALMLPISSDFYLTVPERRKQFFSDTDELSYVCFYPKDSEELEQVIDIAEQTLEASFVKHSREPSYLIDQADRPS